MNEFVETGPPISGNAYEQNRKLVSLLRETISKLDDLSRFTRIDGFEVSDIANWLEAEVSIIVT